MSSVGVSRVLPYRPEELFEIAADVERYPEFLPWWLSATILRRADEVYYTDQTVGFGPIRQRFSTKTVLRPPHEIEVTSIDGPFETFQLTWRFGLLPQERCKVALTGMIELRAPMLRHLLGQMVSTSVGSILAAFEDRALCLYGPRHDSGRPNRT
jgi:coenzyme Q-binding protein COQ10